MEGAGAIGCSVLKWSVLPLVELERLIPPLVFVALVALVLGAAGLSRLFLPLTRCLCSILGWSRELKAKLYSF